MALSLHKSNPVYELFKMGINQMKILSKDLQIKLVMTNLIALNLLACQPSSSNSTQSPVDATTPQATEVEGAGNAPSNPTATSASGITIEVQKKVELRADRANIEEFKKNLNLYVVKIKIPEEVFLSDISIVSSENPHAVNPKYTLLVKGQATYEQGFYYLTNSLNLWDKDFKSKTITYKVISQEKTVEEVAFELYPDFVVKEAQGQALSLTSVGILSGHYRFGVLLFEKGSVLRTQGAAVKLQAERLYADDAKIESFSEAEANTFPAYGVAGRSGGHLTINAVSAVGRLTFEMRGTTGGQGYPALVQDKKAQVRPPGQDGDIEEYCEAPFLRNAPLDVKALNNRFMRGCSVICTKNPEDGLPGDNGFDGFPGNKGGVGGSSGFVEIHIEKPAPDFQAQVFHTPGKGGLGSPGSPGTPGTEGGLPGNNFRGICAQARQGAPGRNGMPGANGANGDSGATEVSQITIAGQRVL